MFKARCTAPAGLSLVCTSAPSAPAGDLRIGQSQSLCGHFLCVPAAVQKAEGWRSGVLANLPAACTGTSAKACATCSTSKAPAACYKCAVKAATSAAKVKAVFGSLVGNTWADGCSACVALPAASQAACFSCLARDAPCGQCAYDKVVMDYMPIDLPTCIACTSVKPAKPYAKCLDCSVQARTASARAKCSK